MHFTSIIVPALLSFATTSHAWTNGVANGNYYRIGNMRVVEACTQQNTNNVLKEGSYCAYWLNGRGDKLVGTCRHWKVNDQAFTVTVECVPKGN